MKIFTKSFAVFFVVGFVAGLAGRRLIITSKCLVIDQLKVMTKIR
jgi:hypothetical protein